VKENALISSFLGNTTKNYNSDLIYSKRQNRQLNQLKQPTSINKNMPWVVFFARTRQFLFLDKNPRIIGSSKKNCGSFECEALP